MSKSKSTFPKTIRKMIASRRSKGYKAVKIADDVNNSATARKLGVNYTTRQIAAVMAWHTINEIYG